MTFEKILERAKPDRPGGGAFCCTHHRVQCWMDHNHDGQRAGFGDSQSGCAYGHLLKCRRANGNRPQTDLVTLKGYDNRVKRDELVAVIMADIQAPADILDKISTSCSAHYLEARRNAMLWASNIPRSGGRNEKPHPRSFLYLRFHASGRDDCLYSGDCRNRLFGPFRKHSIGADHACLRSMKLESSCTGVRGAEPLNEADSYPDISSSGE